MHSTEVVIETKEGAGDQIIWRKGQYFHIIAIAINATNGLCINNECMLEKKPKYQREHGGCFYFLMVWVFCVFLRVILSLDLARIAI